MIPVQDHPVRGRRGPEVARAKALVLALREEFDAPFRVLDADSGEALAGEPPRACPAEPGGDEPFPPEAGGGLPRVVRLGDGRYRLVLPFHEPGGSTLVAVGDLRSLARSPADLDQEQKRLGKWLTAVHRRLTAERPAPADGGDPAAADDPLPKTLGAILGLSDLLRGTTGQGASADARRRVLRRAAELVPAESLLWVPADGDEAPVIEGRSRLSPRDCARLASLVSRCPGWDPSGCLLLERPHSEGLARLFPSVLNLIALSADGRGGVGWLIAVNKRPEGPDSPPFRRLDSALLMPFAALLGLQSRTDRGQARDHEHLTGLVRTLTAMIDSKDPNTPGHSERVARVAVEVGRELGHRDRELGELYLAGLLRDIGNIAISDSILAKAGPLSSAEFEHVREHVIIGFRILADFRTISCVLPSVLYHHERYDGTGYPEGLRGEAIPLPARVLAVADSYVAMSTPRPYRPALSRDEIRTALLQGSDRQWDGRVVQALLRCRERVDTLTLSGVGRSVCLALDNLPGPAHPSGLEEAAPDAA